MAAAGTDDRPAESDIGSMPPRQKTALARYSRSSKLTATALLLAILAASPFLVQWLLQSESVSLAIQHVKPLVHGADSVDKSAGDDVARPGEKPAASSDILNQQDDHNVPMAPAPDPGLTESTPLGDLPRIGEDGRQPWQVYSRPFNNADRRPRIAILVADLGLQRAITDAAVSRLPANVTLAFDAQSPTVAAWCNRARQQGHEVLLSVPMEPFDFPRSDPGPHTLLTGFSNPANLEKLAWAMRQASGYVGITTLSGSRFITESDKLKPILQTLKLRGLLVFDAHIAPHSAMPELAQDLHVPFTVADQRLDDNLSPEAIDQSLLQLEQAARLNGKAVGVFSPLPIVIDRLQAWLQTLPQAGIALAPVSAVVQ